MLHAVERAAPGSATAALTLLESGQASIETVLTALLNELSVLPHDLNLVLDDYHLAEGPDVQTGVAFLVDHLPPQVHVVISTRADPALPLARFRARGELVEVRAADLRFTGEEATVYLNDLNSLSLNSRDVAALESRTEGWAAALQLAALSLQGRDDRSQFIAGFAGDDRFVVDYLADEVLDRQPRDVRRFLLDTSVLDRLSAPLCDAVTGSSSGKSMLETLERENLFVIPLDAHRTWYRYHHLFADVLHMRLRDERPAEVAELHRRASEWFEQSYEPEAAVRHALAANDIELAATQVELAIPTMLRERREAVICRWVDDLPADIVRNRPVLAVGFVAALAQSNRFEGLDQRLADAEHILAGPVDHQVVADAAELARLPAAVATYRAALALVGGDLPGTVANAQLALDRAVAGDHVLVGSASALLGIASWANGDLDAAHAAYRAATDSLSRAGHVADVLGCAITLGDIEMTQGRLTDARLTFEHALDLAAHDAPPLRGAADMHVGLARVAWERGDLARADEHLRSADELGESAGLPQHPYRWRVAMAQLRAARGDTAAAADLLTEAERVYVGDFAPHVRPIAAVRARVLAAGGDVTGALAWAHGEGLTAHDELSYAREYEHVTLARILLADHGATGRAAALTDTTDLLDRLLAAAEAGGRTGTVIEVLVLSALAHQAAGQQDPALASLAQAVRLAEPEGYVRPFTVGTLRDGATADRARRATATVGLRGTSARHCHRGCGDSRATRLAPPAAVDQGLVDPLSSRELDVLRFLRSDLDGPGIARELAVSLATVRSHTQHIYTKLGVNNRRAAVRRAHQLNLFSRTSRR